MTKYYRSGGSFFIFNQSQQDNVVDRLPVGNYVIKKMPMSGELYFDKYDKEFTPPSKIYGDSEEKALRIISTFLDRPASTGILLTGEKGSGKTMLGKLTCHLLAKQHKIPTIFITEPHTSQAFLELIGNITQPVAIFFDEFEKVYDGQQSEEFGHHDQTAILTLLDGIFSTQTLFILTCNDRYKLDDHLINRPGRIYYAYDFFGLSEDFVAEYTKDNLRVVGDTWLSDSIEQVLKVSAMFRHFNFDMLKALIEEMNRYGESAKEAIYHLNITPTLGSGNEYSATIIPVGHVKPIKVTPNRVGSPLSWKKSTSFYTYSMPESYGIERLTGEADKTPTVSGLLNAPDDDSHYTEFEFVTDNITVSTKDTFELVNDFGEKLILLKEPFSEFDWRAL